MTDERCIICGETEDGNEAAHLQIPTHVHEFIPPSKAVPKVFLVWTGEYADASVVGVYSSRELADAAASLWKNENAISPNGDRVSIEERALDEHAEMARAGVGRWRIELDVQTRELAWWIKTGPGTGEPVQVTPIVGLTSKRDRLMVYCDAPSRDAAVAIAAHALTSRMSTP